MSSARDQVEQIGFDLLPWLSKTEREYAERKTLDSEVRVHRAFAYWIDEETFGADEGSRRVLGAQIGKHLVKVCRMNLLSAEMLLQGTIEALRELEQTNKLDRRAPVTLTCGRDPS